MGLKSFANFSKIILQQYKRGQHKRLNHLRSVVMTVPGHRYKTNLSSTGVHCDVVRTSHPSWRGYQTCFWSIGSPINADTHRKDMMRSQNDGSGHSDLPIVPKGGDVSFVVVVVVFDVVP